LEVLEDQGNPSSLTTRALRAYIQTPTAAQFAALATALATHIRLYEARRAPASLQAGLSGTEYCALRDELADRIGAHRSPRIASSPRRGGIIDDSGTV
jgi:hypothetical protein